MVELKTQYPYIDFNGNEKTNLIKHWAEDENGIRYNIKQLSTGKIYSEAIDVYPCRYTYIITNEKVVTLEEQN